MEAFGYGRSASWDADAYPNSLSDWGSEVVRDRSRPKISYAPSRAPQVSPEEGDEILSPFWTVRSPYIPVLSPPRKETTRLLDDQKLANAGVGPGKTPYTPQSDAGKPQSTKARRTIGSTDINKGLLPTNDSAKTPRLPASARSSRFSNNRLAPKAREGTEETGHPTQDSPPTELLRRYSRPTDQSRLSKITPKAREGTGKTGHPVQDSPPATELLHRYSRHTYQPSRSLSGISGQPGIKALVNPPRLSRGVSPNVLRSNPLIQHKPLSMTPPSPSTRNTALASPFDIELDQEPSPTSAYSIELPPHSSTLLGDGNGSGSLGPPSRSVNPSNSRDWSTNAGDLEKRTLMQAAPVSPEIGSSNTESARSGADDASSSRDINITTQLGHLTLLESDGEAQKRTVNPFSGSKLEITAFEELSVSPDLSTPATKKVVDLLRLLVAVAPKAVGNKHLIYSILRECCEICTFIVQMGSTPSELERVDSVKDALKRLEKYCEILNALEE
ncbi:hypothetical protein FRB90_007779 [Tulasnella sp. 427]|nr:hypothetical protein FRB90_007779 [Tulasnella sp. 427]